MKEIILEQHCEKSVPSNFRHINLAQFGEQINLYTYQQDALRNAMNCLNDYYADREKFYNRYAYAGTELIDKISISKTEDNTSFDILENHYNISNDVLPFKEICNRASFWMATGSGKTLVMVKLIQVLFEMSKLSLEDGGIPKNDILILAPSDKILEQIQGEVKIFNRKNDLHIEMRDLREWAAFKRQNPNLYKEERITVFYYRSNNIKDSGIDTANETNYLNYMHGEDADGYKYGSWYVLLDEAHKGVTGDSRRQNIYTALAKQGFLFNFSATFTDAIDKATTVYNFNLERFIKSGYGKHLKVTNQQFRGFKRNRDDELDEEQKKNIVLKSLIMLTAIKKACRKVGAVKREMYHNPLMITIANTIQTQEADLKIFFQQLAKIAKEDCDLSGPKKELLFELSTPANRKYQFNSDTITNEFIALLDSVEFKDVKELIFNTKGKGSIEIVEIKNNQRELAFKMSTANSKPFALLVASDATKWMKDLDNYSVSTDVVTDSFYDNLNEHDNQINILLGKQIFAEGWDSNRPNVINFINIGVSDAQKFVLQAIGRGIRIEPFENQRNRLERIPDREKFISLDDYNKVKKYAQPVESLFIFSTNKEAVGAILENIERNSIQDEWRLVEGIKKTEINDELPVPEYEPIPVINPHKFRISLHDYHRVREHIEETGYKVLIAENNVRLTTLKKINTTYSENFVTTADSFSHPSKVILSIDTHFRSSPKKFKRFRQIEDKDITHFTKIKTSIDDAEFKMLESQILTRIEKRYPTEEELDAALERNEISVKEYKAQLSLFNAEKEGTQKFKLPRLDWNFLKEHYYNPVLLADRTNKEFYQHIIDQDSEVVFFKNLVTYAKQTKPNNLQQYDWWYFSKLVQNVDEISIPYFNTEKGEFANFFPDFVFWLKKGNEYYIKFIDPKGRKLGLNETRFKAKGFEDIFINNGPDLKFNKKNVNVQLVLYNPEGTVYFDELRGYFHSDFESIF